MTLIRHVARLHQADHSDFIPFQIAGRTVGWVRRSLAARLVDQGSDFVVADSMLVLSDASDQTPQTRSAALDRATQYLVQWGVISRIRGERYDVLERWGMPALATIDRAAVVAFGFHAFGVHLNGFVDTDKGRFLWLGKRAMDRAVAPGLLDNTVAGGQPSGLSLSQNLVKEAWEEAALTPAIVFGRGHWVGALSYTMEMAAGLKRDTAFLYDLSLDNETIPVNRDGEVEYFIRMGIDDVVDRLRRTDDFKFNVAAVLIDFLIRHGHIEPDDKEYLDLIAHLGVARNEG